MNKTCLWMITGGNSITPLTFTFKHLSVAAAQVRGLQGLSGALLDSLGLSGTLWNSLGLSGTFWDSLRLSGAPWDSLRLSGAL